MKWATYSFSLSVVHYANITHRILLSVQVIQLYEINCMKEDKTITFAQLQSNN